MNTERITRLEKLLNRELSAEEKERLRRIQDTLQISDEDALWDAHAAMEYQKAYYEELPQKIATASTEILRGILTSPVYYFGVSAQLKLAFDRFFALLEEGMAVNRAALLMTCGNTTDAVAASSISMFRQICACQKWEEAGIIIAPRLHNPGEIEGRAELEQAKRLGENM
ncbi:MAG: NAD(P)H-dependent oxidoreductase [Desulfovibrio sp.]|jgi:hypothetical protein|nr:NAD(P)H-dependent oxidoreductase [Desulfovibrio sp.]